MKRSLGWHQNCLENMRNSLEYAEAECTRVSEYRDRLVADVSLRDQQIREAFRRGMDEFDHSRLLVKRIKK